MARPISPTKAPAKRSPVQPVRPRTQRVGFGAGAPIMAPVLDGAVRFTALERREDDTVLFRARRRRLNRFRRLRPRTVLAIPSGVLSISLYGLLFTYEDAVLIWSVTHSWSFLVPVAIALVFSLVHGSFTSRFWKAIGLRPNTIRH